MARTEPPRIVDLVHADVVFDTGNTGGVFDLRSHVGDGSGRGAGFLLGGFVVATAQWRCFWGVLFN